MLHWIGIDQLCLGFLFLSVHTQGENCLCCCCCKDCISRKKRLQSVQCYPLQALLSVAMKILLWLLQEDDAECVKKAPISTLTSINGQKNA